MTKIWIGLAVFTLAAYAQATSATGANSAPVTTSYIDAIISFDYPGFEGLSLDGLGSRAARSVPVRENLIRLRHLLGRTAKIEFQFAGTASDLDLDRIQANALHAQLELFVGFVGAVLLEAVAHD